MPRDTEPVKPREQARTRLARRSVVDAAGVLFRRDGYVATTVEAVSKQSGVPAATVYRLFESKLGILKALLDTSIGGDDAPVAVADRPAVANLRTETDPRRIIGGFVAITAGINGRTSAVYAILTGAATTDAEAADLLAEIQRQRGTGQRRLTKALARLDALPAGLSETRAADIVHALMSPETYRLLVLERRWSVRRYREWLETTLCQQLIGYEAR